jgi:zinc transport system substrate-binding protein
MIPVLKDVLCCASMRSLGLVLLISVVLTGCGGGQSDDGETVVAAFYPLAWAAEEIGGGKLHVVNLTPPGAEPHDLELTPRDVEEIRDADVVLYLGRGFQPALERALEDRSGASIDLLAGRELASAPEGEEELPFDPHVWLDPSRFAAMASAIGAQLDREGSGNRLAARLRALDEEFETRLASCARRDIVTSHAAFGYLAKRYGLEQIALTGISPEAEPSPRDLERLIDEVEESDATTVFFETLVSPKLAQAVAREAGAETAVLDPLEGLTPGALAAGDDYVSVMRRNLAALREALGCR